MCEIENIKRILNYLHDDLLIAWLSSVENQIKKLLHRLLFNEYLTQHMETKARFQT